MNVIVKQILSLIKTGEIQISHWNENQLQVLAYIIKVENGHFLDFYSIVKGAVGYKHGKVKNIYELEVDSFISDEEILQGLELTETWSDGKLFYSQEAQTVEIKTPSVTLIDAIFPELSIIEDVDTNNLSLVSKQNNKVALLLPERAESIARSELTGVPKIEGVSQMSQGKKWDSIKFKLPRTANERLLAGKQLPPVKQLLGEFWGSGELHILFADTGVGKSLLAVDIADHLSRGKQFLGLKNEFSGLKVIYYDFELTDQQFWNRYSNDKDEHYQFSSSMHSDPIDLKEMSGTDICKFIMDKISHDVEQLGVDVVIIDNITYLVMQSTADGEVAIKLMRFLDELKKEMNVSILVLAHTPKVDRYLPITINSLGGSKHIPNFSDSVSAIGKSRKGDDIRYWKQIKCRQFKEVYAEGNVLDLEITKPDKKIEYQSIGTSNESEHLPMTGNDAKKANKEKVLELHMDGKSLREISDETGVSKSTVSRWVKTNS